MGRPEKSDSMDMNLGKFQEMMRDREAWQAMGSQRDLVTEQQVNDLKIGNLIFSFVK